MTSANGTTGSVSTLNAVNKQVESKTLDLGLRTCREDAHVAQSQLTLDKLCIPHLDFVSKDHRFANILFIPDLRQRGFS